MGPLKHDYFQMPNIHRMQRGGQLNELIFTVLMWRYLMCSQDSMGVVPPPNTQTVKKTMSSVVVNIIWRA